MADEADPMTKTGLVAVIHLDKDSRNGRCLLAQFAFQSSVHGRSLVRFWFTLWMYTNYISGFPIPHDTNMFKIPETQNWLEDKSVNAFVKIDILIAFVFFLTASPKALFRACL